jgi:hypothetical protein
MKVTIKEGTKSTQTGELGPAEVERAVHAKHSTAGAHSLTEHGDGSYTMEFPSAEHYEDFIDEVATCSADEAVKADILRRHANAS